jgi:signal transduction histidine kinase
MPGSRIADAVLVTVGVVTAAAAVAWRHVGGAEAIAELVFASVVATSLLLVCRRVVHAVQATVAQHSAARALHRRPAAEAVRHAVADERVRLAADIETVVRTSVRGMRAGAEQALQDDDPVEPLREVQRLGRAATAELRRLLGLLRDAHAGQPEPAPALVSPIGWRTDLLLATGAVILAVVEHYVENVLDGWLVPGTRSAVSVACTVAAAATLVLRRHAPAAGAALCGLAVLAAAAFGHPVTGGFWIVAVPGVLCYAAVRQLTWAGTCGAVTLLAALATAFAWRDPLNLTITAETMVIAGLAATLVALADRRRAADRTAAARRSAELSAATAQAVHAERLAVAREIHDVVSHAVGVMVMQAAAAELLLPSDRHRARTAMLVVRSVANDALSELDALVQVNPAGLLGGTAGPSVTSRSASTGQAAVPSATRTLIAGSPALDAAGGPTAAPAGVVDRHSADLAGLVERMRRAGLTVELDAPESLGGDTGATVYRIVQEALTNVLRHAPGAAVAVAVRRATDGAHIEVADDGPGPAGPPRHGYGLAGIAERVHRLGGTLHTGRGSDGNGFRIEVHLPATPPP